jgi:hypothetical protein
MTTDSADTPTPHAAGDLDLWLAALHASSRRLANAVNGLSEKELSHPSFTDDWNIAQVLSHLGSAAEISTSLLERGLVGDTTGPQRETVMPVWERWDDLSGPAQRAG